MAYTNPNWTDNSLPAINATNLNAISNTLAALDWKTVTKTIYSSSWTNTTPSTYTISDAAIKSTSIVQIVPGYNITSTQIDAFVAAKAVLNASADQINGSIKLTAKGTKPSVDVPVILVISG